MEQADPTLDRLVDALNGALARPDSESAQMLRDMITKYAARRTAHLEAALAEAKRGQRRAAPSDDDASSLGARVDAARAAHRQLGNPGDAVLVMTCDEVDSLLAAADERNGYETDLNFIESALGQRDEETLRDTAARVARELDAALRALDAAVPALAVRAGTVEWLKLAAGELRRHLAERGDSVGELQAQKIESQLGSLAADG